MRAVYMHWENQVTITFTQKQIIFFLVMQIVNLKSRL